MSTQPKCVHILTKRLGLEWSLYSRGTNLHMKTNQTLINSWKTMPKNVHTTTQLHSFHTLACTTQILQVRLQQYVNREFPDIQAELRKGRGTRDQFANIQRIIEKARKFQKNIYFCFIDYPKAFDYVDHNKLWKILQEMGIPDHLTCLLRNLYAGQEATVRPGHGTTDCFQIGEGVHQGCILSPFLFNLYAECIVQNARLDEAQLESRLPGEISVNSDMQMTLP